MSGQVDQRSGVAKRGDVVDRGTIDQVEMDRGVDSVADALEVATTHDGDVERWLEAGSDVADERSKIVAMTTSGSR